MVQQPVATRATEHDTGNPPADPFSTPPVTERGAVCGRQTSWSSPSSGWQADAWRLACWPGVATASGGGRCRPSCWALCCWRDRRWWAGRQSGTVPPPGAGGPDGHAGGGDRRKPAPLSRSRGRRREERTPAPKHTTSSLLTRDSRRWPASPVLRRGGRPCGALRRRRPTRPIHLLPRRRVMWPLFYWYATDPSLGRPHPVKGQPARRHGTGHVRDPSPVPTPSQIDLELVRSAYRVIARESHCTMCGRTLRSWATSHPTRPATPRAAWSAKVTTRCRGWRLHRAEAIASLVDDELRLGPLGSPQHRRQRPVEGRARP